LSLLLLTKFRRSNIILGLVILVISIQIFDFFSAYSLISLRYPHLIDISVPLGLLNGPLIYLLYFYFANRKYPKNLLFHLIPAAVIFINQTFYYFQSSDFKYNSFVISRNINLPLRDVPDGIMADPLGFRNFGGALIALSLGIYSIFIIRELFNIIRQNKKKFWKVEENSLKWWRNFALLFMVLTAYVILNQLIAENTNSEYVIATCLTLIIYYTSYHFIHNSFLINESFSIIKYEKSALSDQMKNSIKERLIRHMQNDKPYLNNMFSLKKLSKNISASPNHVSQIINENFNQSYFEFIATYRIQEAQRYLLDPDYRNKNIEEISFRVGYNSKTAFNRAFKKLTGKTPLHYKKNL